MGISRIVFARGNNRLELEGDTEFVERQLADLLPLLVTTKSADTPSEELDAARDDSVNPDRQSLRTFVAAKGPKNTYDAIACVLFYARTFLSKQELTADEIRTYLIQAKQRPPAQMAQALVDAKRRYGYVDVGTRKGTWALGHGGEVRVEIELSSKADE